MKIGWLVKVSGVATMAAADGDESSEPELGLEADGGGGVAGLGLGRCFAGHEGISLIQAGSGVDGKTLRRGPARIATRGVAGGDWKESVRRNWPPAKSANMMFMETVF